MKKLALVIAACIGLSACNLSLGGKQIAGIPPSYVVKAEFPSTIGLYPGSFVRQLGINVGQVSGVANQGDHVLVTMKIFKTDHLAANADAVLVGDSVLGERYVQFEPAYVSGATLQPGTTLGLDRVTVPVETDTVLRSLNTVIRGVNPTNLAQFTTNLATLLNGEGQNINSLITNAAGTVALLANKSTQLGQLTTTLATLTGQLDTRDQELADLITAYDTLSGTLAADSSQLDGTITNLTNLTTQGTSLLVPNLAPIQADVADLTAVGQTLDRNIPAIDVGLTYGPRLFSAAQRAYDPAHNWLPLNTQASPSPTSAVLEGQLRDALSSVCRRVASKNSALSSVLAQCGNPDSGFFDSVLNLLPNVLNQLPGQTTPSVATAGAAAPTNAQQAFDQGVAAIPGLSASQRQSLTSSEASAASAATAPPAPEGPPGAAAIAALRAIPIPTDAAPAVTHHKGFWHWLEHLL